MTAHTKQGAQHAAAPRWPLAAHTCQPAILPSLLAADPLRLAAEIDALGAVDALHVDVMDGHFVPNLAFAPATLKALRQATSAALDVHLMVTDPLAWIEPFAAAGATALTGHLETMAAPGPWLTEVAAHKMRGGLSLRPTTPVQQLTKACGQAVQQLDHLLMMGVEPGFGGQALLADTCERLAAARKLRADVGAHFAIVLDGGVALHHVTDVVRAGADALVVGSDLFKFSPYRARQETLRAAADRAAAERRR